MRKAGVLEVDLCLGVEAENGKYPGMNKYRISKTIAQRKSLCSTNVESFLRNINQYSGMSRSKLHLHLAHLGPRVLGGLVQLLLGLEITDEDGEEGLQ